MKVTVRQLRVFKSPALILQKIQISLTIQTDVFLSWGRVKSMLTGPSLIFYLEFSPSLCAHRYIMDMDIL